MKRALLLLVFAAGCSKETAPPPSKSPLPQPPLVSKAAPGRFGGRLFLSTLGTPKTFNPLLASDAASVEASQWLFASLVRVDFAEQEVRPGLAESWSVAPDQKTWTFKLRRGLRWSDGAPLTAEDVLFTWNQVIFNPQIAVPAAEMFQLTPEKPVITNIGADTIQVVAPEVFAPFLEFFGTMPILPKHALEQSVKEKRFPAMFTPATPDKIACSGPFRVRQVNRGATILERNPEYWVVDSKNHRLPYFEEVVFIEALSVPAQADLFLSGETHIYDRVRSDEFEKFNKARKSIRLVDLGAGADKDFICFNQNTNMNAAGTNLVSPAKLKWFRDAKFRQAISSAVDRDRIAKEIYFGRAAPAYHFVSAENKKWHNASAARFPFDTKKARALLAEVGFQDRNNDGTLEDAEGNPIEFTLMTNTENAGRLKTATFLRDEFAKLGIRMKVQTLDFQSLILKVNGGFDYECALLGLGGGSSDPVTGLSVLKSSAPVHQWFPNQTTPSTDWEARVDALMDEQMGTLDFAARKKAFDEVQTILGEQQPMIFTVSPNAFAAVSAKIGNVRPSAVTPNRISWNLEDLFFK